VLPETLPYYENQPGPPGYRLEERKGRGLIIAGSVLFGSAWVISALGAGTAVADGGSHSGGEAPLFVPVIGPFITLGTSHNARFDRDDERPVAILYIFDGIAQTVGLAMLIGGLSSKHKVYVREEANGAEWRDPASRSNVDSRVPDVAIGPRGGSLSWKF
jgi:hypothetical protein